MTVPQGSATFDASYFDNLVAQLNAISLCSELQSIASAIFANLAAVKAAINAELADLQPILALLTAPGANLTELANWISSFITHTLTPLYQPYITMTSQLTAFATQLARVVAAVQAAVTRIGNCPVTIPSI